MRNVVSDIVRIYYKASNSSAHNSNSHAHDELCELLPTSKFQGPGKVLQDQIKEVKWVALLQEKFHFLAVSEQN